MNVDGGINAGADGGAGEGGTSLRDELRATWDSIAEREESAGGGEPAPAAVTEAPAAAPAGEEQPGQPREQNGRFATKQGEQQAPAAVTPPAAAPAPGAEGQPADPNAAAAAPTAEDKAPGSWRAAVKDKWAAIDPDVRAEILRREADASRLASNVDNERRFAREMAETIRPHFETIKGFGVTPQFAVGVLLNNDRIMRHGTPEQKIKLAREMIRDYGLDASQLFDPNAPTDPSVIAMQDRIRQLEQRGQVPQQFNHAPLPEQGGNDNVTSDIEAFRADPAHPHFDQVAPMMATLLEGGHAADLTSAYEMAVRSTGLTPAAPAPAPAPSPQPPANPQPLAAQQKVQAARHAGASVARSPGPSGEPAPTNLRDELRANLRKHGWGA